MYIIEMLDSSFASQEQVGNSAGVALNINGDVAGTASIDGHSAGVVWGGGSPPFVLDAQPFPFSLFFDINDMGVAVGQAGNQFPTLRAVMVRNGAVKDLGPKVGMLTRAMGINNAGDVCGLALDVETGHLGPGFLLKGLPDTVTQIPPLPGDTGSYPWAISEAGDVVGNSLGSSGHGFLFRGGVLTDLGPASYVDGINNSGQVCGSINKPSPQWFSPVIWDTSQASAPFSEIQLPQGSIGGHAYGVNTRGDVVGTCWGPNDYDTALQTAYIYDARNKVSTDLNTLLVPGSGCYLHTAQAINDYGQITGFGLVNGNQSAFLLTPVTLPIGGFDGLPALVASVIFGAVKVDGPGWAILPNGHRVPISPWGPMWADMPSAKRNILIGLALEELATHLEDATARAAIRGSSLHMVRSQIDRLLETPRTAAQAAYTGTRPNATASGLQLQSGRLPSMLLRFGGQLQQSQP